MDDERALRLESRDRVRRAHDFQQSDGLMPMSTGFRNRFRPTERPVVVINDLGRPVSCSPTQNSVYAFVSRITSPTTVRAIALSLNVAPSTVSRALTFLASRRLIAYDIVRGRYGGLKLLSATWADMKMRARKAHEKLAAQREKAADRWFWRLFRSGYPVGQSFNVAHTTSVGRNIEVRA